MIDIVTVAWGDETIERYFKYCLRSLTSKNNSYFINKFKITINLICDQQDEKCLNKYRDTIIKEKINIIYERSGVILLNKYNKHTSYFLKNLSIFSNQNIIPLYPDAIVSFNFLQKIIETLKKKDDLEIIYLPGPKINSIALKNIDLNKSEWNSEKNISNLILEYSHSKMNYLTVNNKYFNNAPAWLVFQTNNFMVFNCFHMTPLCFKKKIVNISSASDSLDVYLSKIALNHKTFVFDNSHEIAWVSYENDEGKISTFFKIHNFKDSIHWIKNQTNSDQRDIGLNSYIVSTNKLSKKIIFFLKKTFYIFIKLIFIYSKFRKFI